MSVDVTTLESGLRVVSDHMLTVETVSVGAWVEVGARDEPEQLNGISHLLEHMAFKGTKRRDAFAVAEEIESVGGHLNAYTSREHTAYFAKILKEDLALAVDLRHGCWDGVGSWSCSEAPRSSPATPLPRVFFSTFFGHIYDFFLSYF